MKQENVSEFMHVFNELQKVVAAQLKEDPDTNFGSLIYAAEEKQDKVVLTYRSQLDLYRRFRNILVHSTINENESIADPSQSLIDEMKQILEKIKHPKTVSDLFLEKVIHFNLKDPLSDVLEAIKDNQISQFPVFQERRLVGMISENGITNFLAHSIKDDWISISGTTIEEVLENDHERDSYEIIPANQSIFDIEAIYSRKIEEGIIAYFLLIAKDGKVTEPSDLLGIITPWDIPEIIENK